MNPQEVIISQDLERDLSAAIQRVRPDRLFVLTDTTTREVCWPVVASFQCLAAAEIITIGATDEAKTLETLVSVWTALGEGGATRHSMLINLGGGMVTDRGGFAASTFRRGIAYISVPLPLLAMGVARVGVLPSTQDRALR